ncbi:MAG: hypothetical protein KDC38_01230 [Planctomycetes bacterium]|nr:hypothetical protein [Planctomycetota bacterium]
MTTSRRSLRESLDAADYEAIESEIASDDSPVGIDAKKTHVLILGKLEAIERRLDALERRSGASGLEAWQRPVENAMAGFTDAFDETVRRCAARGVDVDQRARATLDLVERLTESRVTDALGKIVDRMASLEQLTALAEELPKVVAAATDIVDDEIQAAAARGEDIDRALRQGLSAILYLGQRISPHEVEALGQLLRSDVLHAKSVDLIGRLGRAMVDANEKPRGSVGPFAALGRLGRPDTKRTIAFLLEFAQQFGTVLEHDQPQNPGKRED